MRVFITLVLVGVLVLSACSEGEYKRECAALIGGGRYCLQPTTARTPFEVQQKVEASLRGRRETLIVNIESDADGLRVIGLTPFGHKVLQVTYDNRAASAPTLPDRRLSPTLLVALLQIALWPTDAVLAGLETPLTLEEGSNVRRILNGDEPTLSIEHSVGEPPWHKMRLIVHAADLELDIETLPDVSKE
jgi:hypothetical protein